MTDIALKPAKPYNGKAQHQALRAALKPFLESGLVTADRFRRQPRLIIDARGWKSTEGFNRHIEVARVLISTPQYGGIEREVTGESRAAFETICTALTAAGWTVDRNASGDKVANVHGPGFDEWAAAVIQNEKICMANDARLLSERQVTLDEAQSILEAHGIDRDNASNDRGYTQIILSLEELRQMNTYES